MRGILKTLPVFAFLAAACGDSEGASGDAGADSPMFGSDTGPNGRADAGPPDAGSADSGGDARDIGPDTGDAGDTGGDFLREDPAVGDIRNSPDLPNDDALAEVGPADAPPDTSVPGPVVCEAPVRNLNDPAHTHPDRSSTRRVPADVSSAELFPELPGVSGTAGGCHAPPVQCADGGGMAGTEVLYRWVPPAPGAYYATTDVFYDGRTPSFFGGSGFVADPVLYLLDGANPNAGVLGCNDDWWPGETQSALTFDVLPVEDGEPLAAIYFVVDAATAAGNGRRYGLEVGPVEIATEAGAACQHPTIATACDSATRLFCAPAVGEQDCRTLESAPAAPALLNVTSTAVVFPPDPPAEPPCRGVARDENGEIIPIVQLRFELFGYTELALQRVSLQHERWGAAPLAIDFPGGPIRTADGESFSVSIELCLPVSLIPFAPDDGADPIWFSVEDDLGSRTEPALPELNRGSDAVGVSVYDPRAD